MNTPSDTIPSNTVENLADDILHGVSEIAKYLGSTTRQTQHLIDTRQLPTFKIGGRWNMRKSTCRAYIAKLEADAMEAA